MISFDRVNEILTYNAASGEIRWRRSGKGRPADLIAGRKTKNRYAIVVIEGQNYLAHRLVWFLHYGVFPENQIDHINGDCYDNRIENLREATASENCRNWEMHREGKLFGAHWLKRLGKWQSSVRVGKKQKYLGVFASEIEANKKALDFVSQNGG